MNGVGAGLGFTILGYGEFIFLAASARLRCPFTQLGLSPEASSSFLFPLRMGWQNAARALIAGRWFLAEAVVASGLGTAVCADGELLDTALGFATELAQGPLESLRATKQLMLAPYRMRVAQARSRETESLAQLRGSAVNRAALDAFHGDEPPGRRQPGWLTELRRQGRASTRSSRRLARTKARQEGAPVTSQDVSSTETVDVDAVRREAHPYLNQWGPYRLTRDPITVTDVRRFCEMVEDGNPVYWDEEVAQASRFGRLIAPSPVAVRHDVRGLVDARGGAGSSGHGHGRPQR